MRHKISRNDRSARAGFTLIELLVVITIIAILAALTVGAIYATANSDRIRGAARQMQSAMQGAMSRSVRADKPVGVRLVLDENDKTIVRTLEYIEQLDPLEQELSQLVFLRPDENPADGVADADVIRTIRSTDTNTTQWFRLKKIGALPRFTRIELPAGSGNWYSVDTQLVDFTPGSEVDELIITSLMTGDDLLGAMENNYEHASDPTGRPVDARPFSLMGAPFLSSYKLTLGNAPLANEDPLTLPNGNVIDLERSYLPYDWFEENLILLTDTIPAGWHRHWDSGDIVNPPGYSAGTYQAIRRYAEQATVPRHMDLMFSSGGPLSGDLSAVGKIHLLLAEDADASIPDRNPENSEGDNLSVSIFTKNGNVIVSPLDKTEEIPSVPYRPYRRFEFAETGEVAGR